MGRADVWVFDARRPGDAFGGEPLAVLPLFGDKPRALAVSPDGGRVHAAVFHSGNRTTTLSGSVLCDGGAAAALDLDELRAGSDPGDPESLPGACEPADEAEGHGCRTPLRIVEASDLEYVPGLRTGDGTRAP